MKIIRFDKTVFENSGLPQPSDDEFEYLQLLSDAPRLNKTPDIEDKLTKIEINSKFIIEAQEALANPSASSNESNWSMDDFKTLVKQRNELIDSVKLAHLNILRLRIARFQKVRGTESSDASMLNTYLKDIKYAMSPSHSSMPEQTKPDMRSLLVLEQLLSSLELNLKINTEKITNLAQNIRLYYSQYCKHLTKSSEIHNDPILSQLKQKIRVLGPVYTSGMDKLDGIDYKNVSDADLKTLEEIHEQFKKLESTCIITMTDFEERAKLHESHSPAAVTMSQLREKVIRFMVQLDRLETQNIRFNFQDKENNTKLIPIATQVRAAIALLQNEFSEYSTPIIRALEARILGLSETGDITTEAFSTLVTELWTSEKIGVSGRPAAKSRLTFDSVLDPIQNEMTISNLAIVNCQNLEESISQQIHGTKVLNLSERLRTLSGELSQIKERINLASKLDLPSELFIDLTRKIHDFESYPLNNLQTKIQAVTKQLATLSAMNKGEELCGNLVSLQAEVQSLAKNIIDLINRVRQIDMSPIEQMQKQYDAMTNSFKKLISSVVTVKSEIMDDISSFSASYEGHNLSHNRVDTVHVETLAAIALSIGEYCVKKEQEIDKLTHDFEYYSGESYEIRANPLGDKSETQAQKFEQLSHEARQDIKSLKRSRGGAFGRMESFVVNANKLKEKVRKLSEIVQIQKKNDEDARRLVKTDSCYAIVDKVLKAIEGKFAQFAKKSNMSPNLYPNDPDILEKFSKENKNNAIQVEIYQSLYECNRRYLGSIAESLTSSSGPRSQVDKAVQQTHYQEVYKAINTVASKSEYEYKFKTGWKWLDNQLDKLRKFLKEEIDENLFDTKEIDTLKNVTKSISDTKEFKAEMQKSRAKEDSKNELPKNDSDPSSQLPKCQGRN